MQPEIKSTYEICLFHLNSSIARSIEHDATVYQTKDPKKYMLYITKPEGYGNYFCHINTVQKKELEKLYPDVCHQNNMAQNECVYRRYAIQWHNQNNFTDKIFNSFETAKYEYDKCTNRDSFTAICLVEIIWDNQGKYIYNLEKLKEIMDGYYLGGYLKMTNHILLTKAISDNGISPGFSTTDLANYIG